MSPQAQKIEALLFLAGEAVERSELVRLIECTPDELQLYLTELIASFAAHGLTIIETKTHLQLVTAANVASFLASYGKDEIQELSGAAAETLSLVAYRGPISRAEIELIRGVDSRRIIRQLQSRGLVRKLSENEHTPHYVVSEEFLQNLGLTKVTELPDFEILSKHETVTAFLEP